MALVILGYTNLNQIFKIEIIHKPHTYMMYTTHMTMWSIDRFIQKLKNISSTILTYKCKKKKIFRSGTATLRLYIELIEVVTCQSAILFLYFILQHSLLFIIRVLFVYTYINIYLKFSNETYRYIRKGEQFDKIVYPTHFLLYTGKNNFNWFEKKIYFCQVGFFM